MSRNLRVMPVLPLTLIETWQETLDMKILMVLTSHDKLGDTGEKTGFWLEEFVAPYYAFLDAGATITVASPKGGQPPLEDRKSVV